MAVSIISNTTRTFFTSASKQYEKNKHDVTKLTLIAKKNVITYETQKNKGENIVILCNQADVRIHFTNEAREKDIADLEVQGYTKLTTR
ncbi:MAG: hypothetical protein ACI88H_001417 [Cocleimonas sp.]|jgi:hypothetical protein